MNCPVCGKPLVVVERDKIELDWCPFCKGFWFDADEWKLLGVNDDKYNPFMQEAVSVNEKGRKCPICNKIMEKIKIGETIIDRCINMHGVWFDENELGSFVNYSNSEKNDVNTISFLGEVFNVENNR